MLSELFNPVSIVLHMVNGLILFAAIRIWLYKPIRKWLDGRAERVKASLDEAAQKSEEAQQNLDESARQLALAQDQANQTIAQSAQRGQERAQEILDEAYLQAQSIVQTAHQDAELIRQNAREAMKEEASKLAIQIAEKVLQREVSAADNQKIIEEFLKKVG